MASTDAGGGDDDDDGDGDGERECYFCHRLHRPRTLLHGRAHLLRRNFEARSSIPLPAFLNLWAGPSPPQISYRINAFFDNVEDLLHDGEDPFHDGEEHELYDEELLICMAIGDNRRGASPTSKAGVDSVPVIRISEELLASDSAQCAVCKDSFELGSSAKQLPRKHLYHAGCVLPWLDLRNSCPVCRYELPTDDDDYDAAQGWRRFGRAR